MDREEITKHLLDKAQKYISEGTQILNKNKGNSAKAVKERQKGFRMVSIGRTVSELFHSTEDEAEFEERAKALFMYGMDSKSNNKEEK